MHACSFVSSLGFMHVGQVGGVFSLDILDDRPGILVFQASGVGAINAFRHEGGGHRFQRVPPTEKRGRTQTSTVTVAVLPVPADADVQLGDQDLTWQATRGSGSDDSGCSSSNRKPARKTSTSPPRSG